MTTAEKQRIAIVYGGASPEHEVSIQSAQGIIHNIDKTRFEPIPIKINRDSTGLCDENFNNVDVVFNVIHGNKGEDGCLQGYFESKNIPYVGSGVLSSALCMDKYVAKRLVEQAGFNVAPYFMIPSFEWHARASFYSNIIQQQLHFPLFVKPVNAGSSIGVSKIVNIAELEKAMNLALQYDQKALIESAIDARDIELSVLESENFGQPPLVSMPGEIVSRHAFYSYEAKYIDDKGAQLVIPAKIDQKIIRELQTISSTVFQLLNCEGFARVDFLLERHTNKIYFNEVNTLPGFTPISMYPKLWEATGISYSEIITKLIELGLARFKRRQALSLQLNHSSPNNPRSEGQVC